MYHPQVGRFLQRDPFAGFVTSPLSLNRFTYVENNPVGATDPTGLASSRVLRSDRSRVGAAISAGLAGLAALLSQALGGPHVGPPPSPPPTPAPTRSKVVLDTSALIRGLDWGELGAVDAAIAGRVPLVPQVAADEYLVKGDRGRLANFLQARGGYSIASGSRADIRWLQQQAAVGGYVLHTRDAAIVAAARREGVPVVHRDRQLGAVMRYLALPEQTF